MEIGLQPLQAMQNIAVINGRPSLWGDAVIALARSSPLCEYIIETQTDIMATCRVKRRGEPEQERTFSMADAQAAGLKGKAGPWSQYPKRMMQMRARGFAIRDVFPDVLKGLAVAEEQLDIPERHMGPADVVKPDRPELSNASRTVENAVPAALPDYSDEQFSKNLPTWRGLIESGKRTAEQIIAMVSSKAVLSEDQRSMIMATVVAEEVAT
jgi:hypothetical protein